MLEVGMSVNIPIYTGQVCIMSAQLRSSPWFQM